jgi:dihydropteroate synthase
MLDLNKERTFPFIMGIVNVTPDSFSDGGLYDSTNKAITHALKLIDDGADIVDIGGESTRPGASEVSVFDEVERVVGVIQGIRAINQSIPISIDTSKAEVARQAVLSGATIVNDVTGGLADERMFNTVAELGVPYVLMHIQGTPRTMQVNPTYNDVVTDVYNWLDERIKKAKQAGINTVIADVGIGFGKSLEHNLQLLRNLPTFRKLNVPLLLGLSRKSFMKSSLNIESATERDIPTAFFHAVMLIKGGADIIRVHNVELLAQLRKIHSLIS